MKSALPTAYGLNGPSATVTVDNATYPGLHYLCGKSVQTNGSGSKNRWQVELFIKWIKKHLRIKRFFGTSDNEDKAQIWIAVAV